MLDGGDNQPVVPPGVYTIRVEVNPGYTANGGNCPFAKDLSTGLCHQFAESNYANNVGTATVIIPDHPGRQGYGTIKNAPPSRRTTRSTIKGSSRIGSTDPFAESGRGTDWHRSRDGARLCPDHLRRFTALPLFALP